MTGLRAILSRHAYIAVGVAQHFNRSVLFGLGLAFFGFILYHILAFSEPGF